MLDTTASISTPENRQNGRSARRLLAGLALVAATSLGLTSPALAHEGHRSCGEGARSFTVPAAQGGEMGELASSAGQQGTAGETSGTLHAEGCEPQP